MMDGLAVAAAQSPLIPVNGISMSWRIISELMGA